MAVGVIFGIFTNPAYTIPEIWANLDVYKRQVLGCVEEQRAKYLYIQDHLNEVRAVFKPLGYAVLLYLSLIHI